MSADRGGGREVAYRIFAAEYDDASLSHTESDEERAPNYVITPTGARVNRLFAVGTLTEVTQVNDEMVRARIVDPTGAFVVYAGQYQPDQLAFLERVDPPAFVALTGKARTFEPEDGDRVYTSVRPESLAIVDGDTRDRWVVDTAERTLDRIRTYAAAAGLDVLGRDLEAALDEAGVDSSLATGIPLAQDHYGTTPGYLAGLRDLALDAAAVVAGDLNEVEPMDLTPEAAGTAAVTFADLADGLDAEVADALQVVTDRVKTPPTEPVDATVAEPETAGTTGSGAEPADASVTETEPSVDDEADFELGETSVAETQPVVDEETGDDEHGDVETIERADESVTESDEIESTEFDDIESTESDEIESTESDEIESTESDEIESTESDDGTTETDVGESAVGDEDELGDFESGDLGSGMYEMDDEERAEIEAEFGTEFATGTEIDDPGEADIDVPDPDEMESSDEMASEPKTESEVESDVESDVESEAEPDVESEAEPDVESEAEPDVDVDLDEYVVEKMRELDDGPGADRTEVIETVVADTGASTDDVEDAIQDALMGGQCYEPEDDTLKAI